MKDKIAEILKEYTKKKGISASTVILEAYAEELVANGCVVNPFNDAKHGEWEVVSDEYEICASEFVCSVCKESFSSSEMTDEQFFEMMNFCPNCGADMRKGGAKS